VLIGVLALNREGLVRLLEQLRRAHERATEFGGRYAFYLIVAVILIVVIEVLARFGKIGVQSVAVGGVAAVIVAISLRRSHRESEKIRALQLKDPTLWVEQANLEYFLVTVIPCVAVRLISLFGALLVQINEHSWGIYGACLLTSIAFLFVLRPSRDQFMMHCPRCHRLTSRALYRFGHCPQCDQRIGAPRKPGSKATKQIRRTIEVSRATHPGPSVKNSLLRLFNQKKSDQSHAKKPTLAGATSAAGEALRSGRATGISFVKRLRSLLERS